MKSTLILSCADGAIIQSSGFPTVEPPDESAESNSDLRASIQDRQPGSPGTRQNPPEQQHQSSPEVIARAVYAYVSEAGKLVDVVGSGDDVQLLRLRTKKQEIVIVPGRYSQSRPECSTLICPVRAYAS